MGKIFRLLLVLLTAAGTSALVTTLYHTALKSGATPSLDLSYVAFLSITLTALGLMITILGFFVAAAGVIGWTTLETKLRDHSMTYFKNQLSKDGELRTELEELFADIAYEGVEKYRNEGKNGEADANPEEDRDYHD